MMPSEAIVVVKVKNVQEVNTKIANLGQQWGLVNMMPQVGDLMGTLFTVTGLVGIDKGGDAAVGMLMPTPGKEPDIIVLVPVSDYKAFAGSLPNSKPDGDLTTFAPPNNKPGFVADWGKYAAISPSKDMVAKRRGHQGQRGDSQGTRFQGCHPLCKHEGNSQDGAAAIPADEAAGDGWHRTGDGWLAGA